MSAPTNPSGAKNGATPTATPHRGTKQAVSQCATATQRAVADGSNLPAGQRRTGTHSPIAGGDPTQPTAKGDSSSKRLARSVDKPRAVQVGHGTPATQGGLVDLYDPALGVLAGVVDDLEGLRTSLENRLRILAKKEPDEDGVQRGHGLGLDHPVAVILRARLDEIKATERKAAHALEKRMRTHPLGPWIKSQTGLGEKAVARLLGEIGDPYWNTLHNRPRTVGELFAYCGVAGRQRRTKGQQSNWNGTARVRLYNVVAPAIRLNGVPDKNGRRRAQSAYQAIYAEARDRYADKLHTEDCQNRSRYNPNGCGTREHPEWGAVGAPWRPGHQHQGAIHLVMREVLRGLWEEARRLHGHAQERAA